MPTYPEADLTAAPNFRQAHRHLATLTPYRDPFDQAPSDPYSPLPVHPSFIFVVQRDDDRPDPQGPVRLTGTLEQHKDELARMNMAQRVGIFVEFPADKLVLAEARVQDVAPNVGLPVAPSITARYGADAHGRQLQQWLWLLTEPATAEQRRTIAGILESRHPAAVVKGKAVLLRLAGFHSRIGLPALVHAHGANAFGTVAPSHDPADLAERFARAAAA